MELFGYQKDALERVEGKKRCAFYHDMGLGKTFTGAEKLMSDDSPKALVVCQKSKVRDWLDHFIANYPEVETYDLTSKTTSFLDTRMRKVVGVINYDLIWRRKWLFDLDDFSLMFDESSLLQNPTSKRTKAAMKLAKAANALVLLSGTPVDGKYERLWTQLNMLGWQITSKLFWRQYVESETTMCEGFPVTKVLGYKNEARLVRKMRQLGCDFLKTEDVIELPKQRFIRVAVPATASYKTFAKDNIVTTCGREFVGDTTFGAMMSARLLAAAYSPYKAEAFGDLIDSTSKRVVVFYNFDAELEVLECALQKRARAYGVLNGKSHDLSEFFDNDDGVALVQYQSGAMGVNLQQSDTCIYFSPPLASSLFEQSKKRTHRIGQRNTCMYYSLVSTGTIECQIYKTLGLRKDYTDKLFDLGREHRNGNR